MRLIDADALYNGAMKDEYFNFVAHDNHGRESFAYSCAMQRLAEAPTIPAIPVEWMRKMLEKTNHAAESHFAFMYVLHEWQNEKSIEELQAESEMLDFQAEQLEQDT